MKQTMNRRAVLRMGLGLGMLPCIGTASAHVAYPNRPIRVVVGLPAGGVADNTMRSIAAQMQTTLGQALVVENKPGASFVLAMNAVEQAPADGYTLIYVSNMMLSAQAVLKRYDIFKSLTPIAMTGATDMALAVGDKSRFSTVKDLIDFGRANPGKLTYATPGVGMLEHLTLATFCKRNGIQAVHVPYKGGPEVVQAIGAGEVDFCVTPVQFLVQFLSKGMIRGLVVLNEKRRPAMPQLPTYQEARVNVPRLVLWGALAAKAGTPAHIISTLEKQAMAAMKNEDLRKRLEATGRDMTFEGGAAFLAREWADDWTWISKAAGEIALDTT